MLALLNNGQYYWEMGFMISELEKICPIHVGLFDIRVGESRFEFICAQYIGHCVLAKVLRLVLTVCGLVAEVLYSTNVCLHMVHQDLVRMGWSDWSTDFLWSLEVLSQLVVSISRIISKKVRFLVCFAYFFILSSKISNLRMHTC